MGSSLEPLCWPKGALCNIVVLVQLLFFTVAALYSQQAADVVDFSGTSSN